MKTLQYNSAGNTERKWNIILNLKNGTQAQGD